MGIWDFLKKTENARKIFGKREIKIIEKQIFGVSLTQSEKNRLSRDIRKKLEFIREIGKYEGEFGLKKGAEIKRIVNRAVDIILESKFSQKIKKIILFGSAVENKMTFRSDIDIAVEFDSIDLKEATEFRANISGKVGDRVDIQVYNILPEKIKREIDLKGRIIYERKRGKD